MEFVELEEILKEANKKVREAVDMSVDMKVRGEDYNNQVAKLWEDFLKNFIGYVKERGRESGENLLAGISFSRIMR